MQSATSFIRRRLKLQVNETKSAVARPQKRKFLALALLTERKQSGGWRRRLCSAVHIRVRELTHPDAGHQCGTDDEGTGQLVTRLEKLLRLLLKHPQCCKVWIGGSGAGCNP